MKTDVHFVKLNTSKRIEDLTVKKIDTLTKKFDWVIKADVFFKQDPSSDGKGKICEIHLSVPGPEIFASSDKTSFEASLAETLDSIRKQLNKRKQQLNPR
ncbi:ribosome-associated translation inhibitor RaiA [Sinomicrobium pectinilyticum]|uniref:Ribosome-associated translation inhibitor RaiA n=1 Tax=Sinomicrobium pectinilyticum TaxID=1084421 RepID=A0A3N0EBY1_SINP1|nr:HPF/RaiA family ribosome-associated protein [Sinomicrobium pectinilyticum]RNL85372.1 ribosome-associated translation inhibitor RaiA [Sinomicrobium pectinilyticum]